MRLAAACPETWAGRPWSRRHRNTDPASSSRRAGLLKLDLPVADQIGCAECSGGLRRRGRGVAFDCGVIFMFDGAQAAGYAGFVVGDGLAVASAVGPFGQFLTVERYFAEVGLALLGWAAMA
jgi:hypothetical protein